MCAGLRGPIASRRKNQGANSRTILVSPDELNHPKKIKYLERQTYLKSDIELKSIFPALANLKSNECERRGPRFTPRNMSKDAFGRSWLLGSGDTDNTLPECNRNRVDGLPVVVPINRMVVARGPKSSRIRSWRSNDA